MNNYWTTDVGDAEQGEKEGPKSCGEGEQLAVFLQDLEVICQAGDHCLHSTHLVNISNLTSA